MVSPATFSQSIHGISIIHLRSSMQTAVVASAAALGLVFAMLVPPTVPQPSGQHKPRLAASTARMGRRALLQALHGAGSPASSAACPTTCTHSSLSPQDSSISCEREKLQDSPLTIRVQQPESGAIVLQVVGSSDHVLFGDIQACEGTVHAIDAVLLPVSVPALPVPTSAEHWHCCLFHHVACLLSSAVIMLCYFDLRIFFWPH